MYAVLLTPVPVRPTSECLHACRRALDHAAFRRDHPAPLIALDDLGDQDLAPRVQSWSSARARVHGITQGLLNGPDGGHQAIGTDQQGRRAAQRRTRSISRRIRGRSRGALTSPPIHKRVLLIIASAIHTIPPCFLTRSSSACTCPKSRGCSTRYSCTTCPRRPERAHQAATVRSSNPIFYRWSGAPCPGEGLRRRLGYCSAARPSCRAMWCPNRRRADS
jgi:hypothetical protein